MDSGALATALVELREYLRSSACEHLGRRTTDLWLTALQAAGRRAVLADVRDKRLGELEERLAVESTALEAAILSIEDRIRVLTHQSEAAAELMRREGRSGFDHAVAAASSDARIRGLEDALERCRAELPTPLPTTTGQQALNPSKGQESESGEQELGTDIETYLTELDDELTAELTGSLPSELESDALPVGGAVVSRIARQVDTVPEFAARLVDAGVLEVARHAEGYDEESAHVVERATWRSALEYIAKADELTELERRDLARAALSTLEVEYTRWFS